MSDCDEPVVLTFEKMEEESKIYHLYGSLGLFIACVAVTAHLAFQSTMGFGMFDFLCSTGSIKAYETTAPGFV